MAVIAAEMKLKKAFTNADGTTNGGRLGLADIASGVRHGIFPRVTRAERTNGVTRYRKVFLKNENNSQESAYGALVYLTFPSPAGDRFYLGDGTQTDTQQTMLAAPPAWLGCGVLAVNATAGATSIQLAMENNDYVFPQNGWLHISSNYKAGQTAAAGVSPGASVTYNAGTWQAAGHGGDTVYPNGIWLGDGKVQTDDGTGHEEWLRIADVATPYSYSGNTATVQLADALGYNYTTTDTWAAACIGGGDLLATVDTYSKSSAAGTYDSITKPVVGNNKGSIEDTITITFNGSGTYTASGATAGALGSGSVGSAFAPVNPDSSTPYFTIPIGFFTGSWVLNDTCSFKTHPSGLPVWIKEVVPAGTGQNANNVFCLGWYWE